ncbi:hypothetical protein [Streptantibioticus ferralitis]|uniref:Uncharacterized protein n=1 Tax=Streptantibioticus ferralitis TaxID=236510 RepID=A0ABT5YYD3_9ACTN|nr:hypothetical protein [Streptantibioticus ferralitis]MDF2256616.1 hypothetical protein [Streptantibioticus ferralitis]
MCRRSVEHLDDAVGAQVQIGQRIGAVGAVREVGQHLLLGHLARERRVPPLQSGGGRQLGCRAESFGIAAGDADGGAVQVVGDDPHLARHLVRFEGATGAVAVREGSGVVLHAPAAHQPSARCGTYPTSAWQVGFGAQFPVIARP